jgi:SAM-dependent methyltransferase
MSPLGWGTASDGTPVAPDGSPVGLYRALPPGREPQIIDEAIPPGSSILELGCGAGRITRVLTALGHQVVAVDQSSEMLAYVQGAEKVHENIESLALGRKFPVVVLGSYLVNTAIAGQREAFLDTSLRHVTAHGIVFVQRTSPAWAASLRPGQVYQSGDFVVTITRACVNAGTLCATQECRKGETTWTHSWTDIVHSDHEFEALVNESGFTLERWLDDGCEWASLRPDVADDGSRSGGDLRAQVTE